MAAVLLSLGSNLYPMDHLRAAGKALRERFGDIVASATYRVPAVGFDGPDFLNSGVMLETDAGPEWLRGWLHALEDGHGRDRSGPRHGDRTLDIDLVFYGDRIIDGPGSLRVPRPELKHAFVLMPLAEIAPDFIDPGSGRSLGDLWRAHPQYGNAFERVEI
ncbi:MAG: 2-amino-4-hydroxy-6-hydroxymethyldihydropteridine diphosphokinase [Xanthomonadaceae bacterium]|jgi:2-amino-4-hydroxy-6-hydroxymethyldihydropteridine diphosphokinase|nr:2-amino-4-hydroxy-6-hydroxymethyldihydropteridine diphosphokinase [Xanthomonadaceae bacterium]